MHYVGYDWRVPQEIAWARLAACFEAGWSSLAASSACGYPDDKFGRHLAAWRRGEVTLLGPKVASDVMRMGRPTRGQVGAAPTRRRLRALGVMGYSLQTLAVESGVNFSTLAMARSRNSHVNAVIAQKVDDVYERLCMIPGPDPQAALTARRKKWLSPLAYDDIDSEVEPEPGPKVDRAAILADLVETGRTLADAEELLGIRAKSIEKWCDNNGHRDLYVKLREAGKGMQTWSNQFGDWRVA